MADTHDTNPWFGDFVELENLVSDPRACFQKAPLAVRDGGQTLGYLIDPEGFEAVMAMAVAYEKQRTVTGRLRITGDELRAIGQAGTRMLSEATEDDIAKLSTFSEVTFSDESNDRTP